MQYETMGTDIDKMEQAAAAGVYAGIADLTKYLLIGGVVIMASAVFPWKQLYKEITQ